MRTAKITSNFEVSLPQILLIPSSTIVDRACSGITIAYRAAPFTLCQSVRAINTVALCPNCHRKMHVFNHKADQENLQSGPLAARQVKIDLHRGVPQTCD